MKIDKQAISLNIAKYRIIANISQIELSRRTGLNKNYLSILENNKGSLPSMNALCNIADALDVDVDKLLYENLRYYSKSSQNSELEKELHFLTTSELEFILSVVRILAQNRKSNRKRETTGENL